MIANNETPAEAAENWDLGVAELRDDLLKMRSLTKSKNSNLKAKLV